MRRLRVVLVGGLVAASVGFGGGSVRAAAAPTAVTGKGTSVLSARLQALEALPVTHRSTAAIGADLGLPAGGPVALVRADSDQVVVQVAVDRADDATVAALVAAGAVVRHTSVAWLTVTAAVPIADLDAVAAVAGVRSVHEAYAPLRRGAATPTAAGQPCGSVVSEGDAQLQADQARAAYAVDGTGVRVGVISDSYDEDATDTRSAADDVASGDLPGVGDPCGHPTPVAVVDNEPDGLDEGRAMLQVVHDLAPGATLAFHGVGDSVSAFADAVTALAADGADVIVDDVGFADEPFYQDGAVGVAYGQAKAGGAIGLSAAGNANATVAGQRRGSYEAPSFRPSTTAQCPAAVRADAPNSSCHDFDPGAGVDTRMRIQIPPGHELDLDLQWAQPFSGVTSDFDAYLLDTTGKIVATGGDNNLMTQEPVEVLGYANSTAATIGVDLVVNRFVPGDTATPRFKLISLGDPPGAFEYPTGGGVDTLGPTVFGGNTSPNVVSVGATAYDDGTNPESFSGNGPATYLFGPVQAVGPAPALAQPLVLDKPDVTATDGAQTTFFLGAGPPFRFYGTSEAAPHAAAVAALALSRNPAVTPDALAALLRSTATPMQGGIEAVGAGRVDALAAVAANPPAAPPTVPEAPTAVLLPLAAAGLGAATLLVGRRRRRPPLRR